MSINNSGPGKYTNPYDLQQMKSLADYIQTGSKEGSQAQLQQEEANLEQQAEASRLDKLKQFMAKDKNGLPILKNGEGIDIKNGSLTRSNPMMFLQGGKALSDENTKIMSAAKTAGLPAYKDRMDSVNNAIIELQQNTNQGDVAAKLQDTLAGLPPAARRAFGTVLRDSQLIPDNTDNSINGLVNKFSSSTNPTYNNAVRQALMKGLRADADFTKQNFDSAMGGLQKALPGLSPVHQAMGADPTGALSLYTAPFEDSYQKFNNSFDNYQKQMNQPAQTSPTSSVMDKVGGGIRSLLPSWLGGSTGAPTQPQAGGPGGMPQAQPQRSLVKQQRNSQTGQIRNVYSDGTTELVNGQ